MAVDLQEIHSGREVIYAFFAKIFLEPVSENEYKMIQEILPLLKNLEDISETAGKEIEKLEDFINKYNSLKGKDLDEFKLDNLRAYTRIFALTDSVPNSESYYTSLEHLVNQESREQVLKLYKNFGFDTDFHDSNEPEDFIAYELMFLSYLSRKTIRCMQDGKEDNYNIVINAQKEFIKDHLLNYIDEFINKMEIFEQAKIFYLPLTYFLREYLKYDYEFLSSLNN